jgi:hypothetical protein
MPYLALPVRSAAKKLKSVIHLGGNKTWEMLRWLLWKFSPIECRFFLSRHSGAYATSFQISVSSALPGSSENNLPLNYHCDAAVQGSLLRTRFPTSTTPVGAQLARIRGGILTCNGAIMTRHGLLIKDWSFDRFRTENPVSSFANLRLDYQRNYPAITRVEGSVLTLTSRWQNNYYHWLLDVMPRLHVAKLASVRFDHLYVACNTAFQRECLAILEVSQSRIINAGDSLAIEASNEIIVPSFLDTFFQGIPQWGVDFVRNSLGRCVGEVEQTVVNTSNGRVYLSRSNAKRRRVANEAELIQKLSSRDFAIIDADTKTVKEQIQIMRDASLVVSPHGAALANILFCRPNTKILEIMPNKYIPGCFYDLANRCGVSYQAYFGSEADTVNDFQLEYLNEDFFVDVTGFLRVLDQR